MHIDIGNNSYIGIYESKIIMYIRTELQNKLNRTNMQRKIDNSQVYWIFPQNLNDSKVRKKLSQLSAINIYCILQLKPNNSRNEAQYL